MATVRINPGYRSQLVGHLFTELAAQEERDKTGKNNYKSDLIDWSEQHFFIPNAGRDESGPIKFPLHQKAVLRLFFVRGEDGHFPFQNIIYSTIKKSGKTTVGGAISRWFAETQARYGEVFTIGNDLDQAKERSFKEAVRSIEITPGYNFSKSILPGRWEVHKTSMRCYLTGGVIKAIAVDAKGEAGGQPALTVWTELWGAENIEAKRFWDEMTPIITIPDSIRFVETYAGYEGESELLRGLYDTGLEGRQLTAGELAERVCRPGVEGEEYQDYVNAWHEAKGDPDAFIPIWINEGASLAMYWDSGLNARRMPWQHPYSDLSEEEPEVLERRGFTVETALGKCAMCLQEEDRHAIGGSADDYYRAQEKLLPPAAFRRLHFNEWVGAEGAFVPMEIWDACGEVHPVKTLELHERTPLVIGADAAITGDCFGTIAVQRCPYDNECVDIRALRRWDPAESGGTINLDEPEKFLIEVSKAYNVVQIAYDPYQMENSAQRLRKMGIVWLEGFNQVGDRLKADSQLYDLILNKRIHYSHAPGCQKGVLCSCYIAPLREHVSNANSKMQKDEDSKLRIVKKSAGKKIDLCVALSMASFRNLYLNLHNTNLLEKVGW